MFKEDRSVFPDERNIGNQMYWMIEGFCQDLQNKIHAATIESLLGSDAFYEIDDNDINEFADDVRRAICDLVYPALESRAEECEWEIHEATDVLKEKVLLSAKLKAALISKKKEANNASV